jgi:hypothetical protein
LPARKELSKMNEKPMNLFIGSGTPAYRIQILGVNSILESDEFSYRRS